jgi:hemerythrin superfamily protein
VTFTGEANKRFAEQADVQCIDDADASAPSRSGTTSARSTCMGKARKYVHALDLLIEQHRKVERLIAKLQDEELEPDPKQFVFQELADNIAAHSEIEEQLFYPAVRTAQTEDLLLESTEEHLAIKRVLADLLKTALDDDRFEAKLSVLKEELDHHAREEEEQTLFPKLRRSMSEEQLIALGSEMLALFERVMSSSPRLAVPAQTSKPARV